MKKIIIFFFIGLLFSLTNLLADEISDCLELEKLKAEKQEVSNSESREIARKICGVRARLGWSTEIAKDFDLCMKKERIQSTENEEITYNQLVEDAIESCSSQAKDKKELEKELKIQKKLTQKEFIKEKELEIERLEEEEKLRRKKEKIYDTNKKSKDRLFIGITPLFWGNIDIEITEKLPGSENTCFGCFEEKKTHSISSSSGFKVGWQFENGQLALAVYKWETEFGSIQNQIFMYEFFSKPSGLLLGLGFGRGELLLNSENFITNSNEILTDESGSGTTFGLEIGYYRSFSNYFQFSVNYLHTQFTYDLTDISYYTEVQKTVTFSGLSLNFDFVF